MHTDKCASDHAIAGGGWPRPGPADLRGGGLGPSRRRYSSIAAAHHISPRPLHRLFRDGDATVAAEIGRQRIEGAPAGTSPIRPCTASRCTPSPPAGAHHRATDFSHAYRAAYGIAPTEYRRRVVAGGPGTALTPSAGAPATHPGA
uniref:AraC family transcriptional regulator n=1 Tax=Streptomyces auratus AGR0001 TaxID=1160718 RepID=J2K374_9ACTN